MSAFNSAQHVLHVLRAQRALSRAQNQGENLVERAIEVRVKILDNGAIDIYDKTLPTPTQLHI